jgi:hypothetical protein
MNRKYQSENERGPAKKGGRRHIQRLEDYNFTSEHRQGRKHNNAAALSRRLCQEEWTNCHKVEEEAYVKQIRAIAVVAGAGWDPVALRTDQLNDPDIGPNLQEIKIGQRPEWKNIETAVPCTRATGLSGSHSLWETAF